MVSLYWAPICPRIGNGSLAKKVFPTFLLKSHKRAFAQSFNTFSYINILQFELMSLDLLTFY